VDEAALVAARHCDRLVDAARAEDSARWIAFLGPLPDRLRDGDLRELRATARKARSAFGAKASLRDDFPPELTEPFLEAIDRLIRVLARSEVHPG
jgi:hypothetical protein